MRKTEGKKASPQGGILCYKPKGSSIATERREYHMLRPLIIAGVMLCAHGASAAHANPVLNSVVQWIGGKGIDKHNEAAERLGYPPLLPPMPGTVSSRHKEMIKHIERERFFREQEKVREFEEAERIGRTG